MIHTDEHKALQSFTAHSYAIAGVVVGAVVFLVGTAIAAYKCYVKRTAIQSDPNSLSSAIRKGLQESNSGSTLAKNPSLRSTALKSPKTTETRPFNEQVDIEKGRSPTGLGGTFSKSQLEPKKCAVDLAVEDEATRGACSPEEVSKVITPTDKDEQLVEKSEDELKIQKLGSLSFTVEYDKQKTALIVTIIRATDLPAKDPNTGSSDPYIKLQLLPEKRHKVKTRVLRKTTSPVYDEIFTFYGIDYNQLQGITLHFVVLSFDRFSRDDIIGEVLYSLSGVDLSEREVTLSREISPRHIKMHSQGRGELLVSLCYQPGLNRLTVVVLKARNLPKMDITGLSDPYVKIYLLYNGQRIAKKKTHVKKRTLNPVFNESFGFDVPCNEGLQNISLEFSVLDWDRVTKNDIIGRLQISTKNSGNEAHHWNEVMNCPRKQIAEWHKLKE